MKTLVELSVTERGYPQYAKITVVPDFSQDEMNKAAAATVEKGSTLRTDGWSGFGRLGEAGYQHEVIPSKQLPEGVAPFPAVHTLISNAKARIGGTFHGLGPHYMQAYLDEFCYRFNRRWDEAGLFKRLIRACVQSKPATLLEIMQRSTVPTPRLVLRDLVPQI